MFRIAVRGPDALDDLRQALSHADCSVVTIGPDTLFVVNPLSPDDHGTRLELRFFLGAWQAARPEVEIELLG